MARAARLSGKSVEELDELEAEDPDAGVLGQWLHRGKRGAFWVVSNLGFFGILLFASVPNPLFDLAGITCGHFLIPFATFFFATLIGKAFVKAQLQTVTVAFVFSKHHVENIVALVGRAVPALKAPLEAYIEAEKARFHRSHDAAAHGASWTEMVSQTVLVTMLLFFGVSIVNSVVQQRVRESHERRSSNKTK